MQHRKMRSLSYAKLSSAFAMTGHATSLDNSLINLYILSYLISQAIHNVVCFEIANCERVRCFMGLQRELLQARIRTFLSLHSSFIQSKAFLTAYVCIMSKSCLMSLCRYSVIMTSSI